MSILLYVGKQYNVHASAGASYWWSQRLGLWLGYDFDWTGTSTRNGGTRNVFTLGLRTRLF